MNKYSNPNTVRASALAATALCTAFLASGCSLLGQQGPPPPPPPAIISTSKGQVDELQHEIKEKDARIASLTSQLAASKEEVAQLKEQKEDVPTTAIPDSGNASAVSNSEATGQTYNNSLTNPSAGDDTSDANNPENITVWVDTSTNTYWLPGSRFYGKGSGQYMTEDQANNDGYKRSNHR